MSTRPSASNNDPGYFYDPKLLMRVFAVVGLVLLGSLGWMVIADFDRPWKTDQRAEMKWEASRAGVQSFLIDQLSQETQASVAADRQKALAALDAKADQLTAAREAVFQAEGDYRKADKALKEQKQFTAEAAYKLQVETDEDRKDDLKATYEAELDKERRLGVEAARLQRKMEALQGEEKQLQTEVDAVKEREMKDPALKRLALLREVRRRKANYSLLREVPLLDFLAPPTKVEQVVLEKVVDNYEFAKPRKVDRCATCHLGSFRSGFEADRWPAHVLSLPAGTPEKVEAFERGVYYLVYDIMDSVTPKVPEAMVPAAFAHEAKVIRQLQIHRETLRTLFVMEEEEIPLPEAGKESYWEDLLELLLETEWGIVKLDKKGKRIERRWSLDKESGKWVADQKNGKSVAEYYLASLEKFKPHWQQHPHFDLMVGAGSPHPYEEIGCSVCHMGRGWSTDFGRAYHTPDRKRIDNFLTEAWAHEKHAHLPANRAMSLDEATKLGSPESLIEEKLTNVGWVTDKETFKRWKKDLGVTKFKLKYWDFPMLPKSLVQASCLKCHKEGLFEPPAKEYENLYIGRQPDGLPDVSVSAEHFLADQDRSVPLAPDRFFVPEKKKPYSPKNLKQGMDNFLRFGCYGCHKLDSNKYTFMNEVRQKPGPPLDHIAQKTTKRYARKWVLDPKELRPDTRMPRFFDLSNNIHEFNFRFAKSGFEKVDGKAWNRAEAYALVEYLWAQSKPRNKGPAYAGGDAARGERIVVGDGVATKGDAKACIACHNVPIATDALKVDQSKIKSHTEGGVSTGWASRMSRRHGPDLAGIGSKVNAQWLYEWLLDPKNWWHETYMPDLRLTPKDAADTTAYLMTLKDEKVESGTEEVTRNEPMILRIAEELKVSEQSMGQNQALALVRAMKPEERTQYVGKKLFQHYGCFGCHLVEDYKDTPPIGTELAKWGSKLIARLEFNEVPIDHTRFDFAYTKLSYPRIYDLGHPRAAEPANRLKMPRFGFRPEEARDIATFLVGLVDHPVERAAYKLEGKALKIWKGRHVLRRANCQACHIIENEGGDVWPVIGDLKWKPPNLIGQGRKTNPAWLFKFLKEPFMLRAWHSINMPNFALSDEDTEALLAYFAAISEAPYPYEEEPKSSLVDADGKPIPFPGGGSKELIVRDPNNNQVKKRIVVTNRLEEARWLFREYQCKSCHSTDPSVQDSQRAPDFVHTLGGRLRTRWIGEWLWGPLKLQPGTAMPSFFKSDGTPQDKQFFGGDGAAQIRALRDYLRYHYDPKDG